MILSGIRKKNCNNEKRDIFEPQDHQNFVADYFVKSEYKGLLLYHTLGSGKSCSSILIADRMLEEKKVEQVFVVTPGSLRENWVEEYCKKCGKDAENLRKYFTFITYNSNIIESIKKIDFNNSLVIIDESHNLINSVKNMSKNAHAIYEKIISSNARVLLLSATVIFNNTFEWCLLMNLLKDNICPNIIKNKKFNREMFDFSLLTKENLKGVISFFEFYDKRDYPEVIFHKPFEIELNPFQDLNYHVQFETELKTISILKSKLDKGQKLDEDEKIRFILANKHIVSKSIENFFFPPEYKEVPDTLKKNGGWISNKRLRNKFLLQMSPKFVTLFINILKNFNTKQAVFTFYKEKGGVILIHNLLKLCGVKSKIFTGDLNDAQRSKILKNFNSDENRYGKNIKILLLTEAGGEGITLLEVENVHLLELSTTLNKTKQAIGRSVRFKSHENMPDDRKKVHVWTYNTISTTEREINKNSMEKYMEKFKDFNDYNDYYKYFIEEKLDTSKDTILNFKDILENPEKFEEFEEFYNLLKENSIEKGNY